MKHGTLWEKFNGNMIITKIIKIKRHPEGCLLAFENTIVLSSR